MKFYTRQTILNNILRERSDSVDMPLKVIEVETFSQPNKWGHDGTITVQYNTKGYRAVYGYKTETGAVSCYMD